MRLPVVAHRNLIKQIMQGQGGALLSSSVELNAVGLTPIRASFVGVGRDVAVDRVGHLRAHGAEPAAFLLQFFTPTALDHYPLRNAEATAAQYQAVVESD